MVYKGALVDRFSCGSQASLEGSLSSAILHILETTEYLEPYTNVVVIEPRSSVVLGMRTVHNYALEKYYNHNRTWRWRFSASSVSLEEFDRSMLFGLRFPREGDYEPFSSCYRRVNKVNPTRHENQLIHPLTRITPIVFESELQQPEMIRSGARATCFRVYYGGRFYAFKRYKVENYGYQEFDVANAMTAQPGSIKTYAAVIGQSGCISGILMDYCGLGFADSIDIDTFLTYGIREESVEELASALNFLHSLGYRHFNLGLHSILVSYSGNGLSFKLAGYGSCRDKHSDEKWQTLANPSKRSLYPPEIDVATASFTKSSDWYMFGRMLQMMIVHVLPKFLNICRHLGVIINRLEIEDMDLRAGYPLIKHHLNAIGGTQLVEFVIQEPDPKAAVQLRCYLYDNSPPVYLSCSRIAPNCRQIAIPVPCGTSLRCNFTYSKSWLKLEAESVTCNQKVRPDSYFLVKEENFFHEVSGPFSYFVRRRYKRGSVIWINHNTLNTLRVWVYGEQVGEYPNLTGEEVVEILKAIYG